jgi:hypothetical protein
MQAELALTAKGQLTLKKSLRDHLGAVPGQRLAVELLPDCRLALNLAGGKVDPSGVIGLLHRPGRPAVSLAEMQEAIEAEAAGAVPRAG